MELTGKTIFSFMWDWFTSFVQFSELLDWNILMDKKELIKEADGAVRKCPHNTRILGVYGLYKQYGFRYFYKDLGGSILESLQHIATGIICVVALPIIIVTIPIRPIIAVLVKYKREMRQCNLYDWS